MESKDEVVSEVHHFSKESQCYEPDSKGVGKEASSIRKPNAKQETKEASLRDMNHFEEKEEECDYTCHLGSNGQVVLWSPLYETLLSRFEFTYPPHMLEKSCPKSLSVTLDEDGDLDVLRRSDLIKKEGVILIEQRPCSQEHQGATTLELVGEQVWRGAFFLADFILHHPEVFAGARVLELAAGVGLSSVVAGMLAKKVIISDVDKGEILELIYRNVKRNDDLCTASTHIKEIDFFDMRTVDDIGALKDDVTVIIAADVVYHNQLTDAFMKAILYLMKQKPNKVMYISLEKRYVFTIEDMDTVAPCYEHFVNGLQWLQCQETSTVSWSVEEISTVNLPQYFTYERTKDLVLWKIGAQIK